MDDRRRTGLRSVLCYYAARQGNAQCVVPSFSRLEDCGGFGGVNVIGPALISSSLSLLGVHEHRPRCRTRLTHLPCSYDG